MVPAVFLRAVTPVAITVLSSTLPYPYVYMTWYRPPACCTARHAKRYARTHAHTTAGAVFSQSAPEAPRGMLRNHHLQHQNAPPKLSSACTSTIRSVVPRMAPEPVKTTSALTPCINPPPYSTVAHGGIFLGGGVNNNLPQ